MRLGLGSSFFLSGVMQGKKAGQDGQSDVKGIAVVNQDYRGLIKSAIVAADDTAKIIEPWDLVGAAPLAGRPIFFKSPQVLFWSPGVVKIGFLAKKYCDFTYLRDYSTDF